ncbi:MAG: signal peptidase II [Clostridia bacterium]|nr:signal peptidase II [Clostridia bacterium]
MILLIAIIAGSIVLDQLTKWLAVVFLQGQPSFPLWEDVLHFTFVKNEGAAFGMLSNHRWVFMIISTVAIIGLTVYLFRFCPKNRLVQISLAMIIGGGIGNMIDRVALGYVIDFIDFTLINFAVFNVADSFVTVGAFLLMGYLIADTVKEMRAPKKVPFANADASAEETQNED